VNASISRLTGFVWAKEGMREGDIRGNIQIKPESVPTNISLSKRVKRAFFYMLLGMAIVD